MKSGQVDAVVTFAPLSFDIHAPPWRKIIFSSAEIPGQILDVVSLDREFLRKRPNVAKAIVRAWDKANAYIKTDPEEAFRIMASRQGITAEEFRSSLQGIKILLAADQPPLFQADGPLHRALQDIAALIHKLNPKLEAKPLASLIYRMSPQPAAAP